MDRRLKNAIERARRVLRESKYDPSALGLNRYRAHEGKPLLKIKVR